MDFATEADLPRAGGVFQHTVAAAAHIISDGAAIVMGAAVRGFLVRKQSEKWQIDGSLASHCTCSQSLHLFTPPTLDPTVEPLLNWEAYGRTPPSFSLHTFYSLRTTYHSLLTTYYLPLTTLYFLLTTHYFLLTTHYSPHTTYNSLLTTYHLDLLLTTHYFLLITLYFLLTTDYLLPTTYHSLLATYYLPLAAHYLLLTTDY